MWKWIFLLANAVGVLTSGILTIFYSVLIGIGLYFFTRRWILVLLYFGVLFWTEGYWYWQVSRQFSQTTIEQPVILRGTITQLIRQDQRQARFYFETSRVAHDALNRRLLLTWYSPSRRLAPGQYWEFIAKLKKPHRLANPGSFDQESWLFTQSVSAIGSVQGKTAALLDENWRFAPLAVLRETIIQTVKSRVKTSSTWLMVLVFGERQDLDPKWQLVLRQTGTNHLLAISGLHVGLLAGMMYFICRYAWAFCTRLCLRWPATQIAAIASLMTAIIYAWLAGFSLSTQRALVMLIVVLWGRLTRQPSRLATRLSVASVLLIGIEPLSLLQSGFVLSFYAVFLLWYGIHNRLSQPTTRFTKLWPQIVMTVGLIPLSAYYFQQISIVSFLANMIAIPWVEVLVLPLLVSVALLAILWPALATLGLDLANRLLDLLFLVLKELAHYIPAYSAVTVPGFWSLVSLILGALLLVMPIGIPGRYLSLIFCLPLFMNRDVLVKPGEFRLTQLDVGQGNATIILTKSHTLVFDTGPSRYPLISSYLRSQSRYQIDKVIISHGDYDHRAGLPVLQSDFPIEQIITADARWKQRWHATACYAGMRWRWDGVLFEIIHPPKGREFLHQNDASCVLSIRSSKHGALLTGDIQSLGEAYLINRKQGIASDILIVPHHGSKTSSGMEFIAAVDPRWAIISTGYQNRFHLPHELVINRYRQFGTQLVNTVDCGAVTIDARKSGIQLECYRDKLLRFYS